MVKDNFNEYIRLKSDKNYIDVAFNEETGGLMATHKKHNFDKHKGHYEKEVQYIGFKYGNSVILESEKGNVLGKSYADGLWNGKDFEIGTSLGTGKNNIKAILNHARYKKVKVVVIYFPNNTTYSYRRLQEGINMYAGQTKYMFEEILYIVEGRIHRYK